MYWSKDLELDMGREATSVHRDEGMVSIMSINYHLRQLADSVQSSYIPFDEVQIAFFRYSTQRRMAHIH